MAQARETQAAKLKRLEAENAALAAAAAQAESDLAAAEAAVEAAAAEAASVVAVAAAATVAASATPAKPRRRPGRAVASAALIVIATLLAPVAVVTTYARIQLTSTDAFVDTLAPLASDPAVQEFLVDRIVLAIDESVGIEQVTDDLFAGLDSLGMSPAASAALRLLQGPAEAGIRSLVTTIVQRIVTSPTFADVWRQSLRVSHTQLIKTLSGDETSAVSIAGDGTIGLELGPILDAVKVQLLDAGVTFASLIPSVDRTIVLAQSDSIVTLQLAYRTAVALAYWLPLLVLAFFAAGVLLARRRARALIVASLALAGSMLLISIAVPVGQFTVASALGKFVPLNASTAIYDALLSIVVTTHVAVLVLAITVAVVAWLGGPFRSSIAVRGFYESGTAALRARGDAFGVTTGRFGEFVYRYRVAIRVLIGAVASIVVLLSRPLAASTVIWSAVLAVVAIGILQLLERPTDAAASAIPAERPRESLDA